ncbi:C-GCAxxG-C-C family (seleno)protein [Shewanella gaetbuli]|uniref:C-GCAxxG-C-C family protein n=1 Tax=Shewanella gaetbuli TaxID=220752 RepID=A0A9X1ZHN5_9GAMM|nr:C-GCAxxG-C-C family (seleno)protein [Shewanella gaetbuli]MCL1141192.1 C-GCAxxG-C-C family protein [Shewanella gaetbuli]
MLDRRNALKKMCTFSAVGFGASFVPSVLAQESCEDPIGVGSGGNAELAENRLTYVKVDPLAVAKRAYEGYDRGGCMYGVFDAVVQELAEQGHEDASRFAAIPTNMAAYGGGGIAGIGSLCGCVNAAAMCVNLLKADNLDNNQVIKSVFRFYEKTSMPRGTQEFLEAIGAPTRHTDAGELLTADLIGQSVANSILCHTSVSLWSKASKFGSSHAAKLERCAQVTAEIAFMTVTFLNDAIDGKLEAEQVAPSNAECSGCHSSTKREPDAYLGSDVNSTLQCQTCHTSHDMTGGAPVHEDLSCSDCHD